MAKLDTEWAISEIDRFLNVTEMVVPEHVIGLVMRGPQTEVSERAHVVEQIIDRVLPGWRRSRPANDEDYEWLRDQASRARAALLRSAELAEKLGDNAPDMGAGNLHPWAWESGRSFWNNGHYHQAVMQPRFASTPRRRPTSAGWMCRRPSCSTRRSRWTLPSQVPLGSG